MNKFRSGFSELIEKFIAYRRASGSWNEPNYGLNINSWIDDSFEFTDKLHYLSKSMGHRSIESTRYYYSIVPRLADTLIEKTETGFNAIVPEVIDGD